MKKTIPILLLILLIAANAHAFSTYASVVEDCSDTSDWTDYSGDWNNTGGACYSNNGGATSIGVWDTSTVSGDWEVYYEVTTATTGTKSMFGGVANSGTLNGYTIDVFEGSPDTIYVFRLDAGSSTALISVSQEVSDGDIIMGRRVGSVIYVYHGDSVTNLALVTYVFDDNYTASGDSLVTKIDDDTGRMDNIGFGNFVGHPRRIISKEEQEYRDAGCYWTRNDDPNCDCHFGWNCDRPVDVSIFDSYSPDWDKPLEPQSYVYDTGSTRIAWNVRQ